MELLTLTDEFEECYYMLNILFTSDSSLLKAFRYMVKTVCQEGIGSDYYIGDDQI